LKKVLIIDDEEKLRSLLAKIIGLEGFDVFQAGDCKTALKKLEQDNIDVVICDVKLPDGSGVELSKKIKEKYPCIEIIMLTAYGTIADSVQAIKNGAFDYITKGDDNNKIIPLLYKAAEKVTLTKKIAHLEKQLGNKYSFDIIIGKSKNIREAIESAQKVATTDATVLLTGETGTGKEVFAQAIHNASKRSKNNIIAINCSAFSKELLENEMFGHKAGAFTGALKDSKGIFEEANNGTVFLDEIGEMPLDLQAKLLRVLETKEFIKVGDTKPVKVDVRIIAATNKNLQQQVQEGNFREDLFYRINVFTIPLPALRERKNDIPELANHFLAVFKQKTNTRIDSISHDFMEHLLHHEWNGNIRELKNVIERAVILAKNNQLVIEGLPVELQIIKDNSKTLSAFDLASVEKLHIQRVLIYTKGNKTEAAKLLNIGLTTLYRKIEEYHIISS
jgi:two-component system NtrC family response regulator